MHYLRVYLTPPTLKYKSVSMKTVIDTFKRVILKSIYFFIYEKQTPDRMCVPHGILSACEGLVSKQVSEVAKIECIPARDR